MSDYDWVCHVCAATNDKTFKRCDKCSSPMVMTMTEIEARKNPSPPPLEEQSLSPEFLDEPNRVKIKPLLLAEAEQVKWILRAKFVGAISAPLSLFARHYLFADLISLDKFIGGFLLVTIFGSMCFGGASFILRNRIHRVLVPLAGSGGGSDFLYEQASSSELKNYLRMVCVSFAVVFFAIATFSMIFSKLVVYAF